MDKLVITRLQGKICTASVSDRKVTGITLEEEDKVSVLNNIYIGKVQKVVAGINAAFIDLGVTIIVWMKIKTIYLLSREEVVN